jgi:hypothetical protein
MTLCTTPLEVGTTFLETLWYSYACRIIDKAIEIYKLDEDIANEIKQKFLKRGDFTVAIK